MRGCGDMRYQITLLRKVAASGGDARDNYEPVLTVRAAKREMSQREFAGGSAMNYERVVIYTIRTPRTVTLTDGLTVQAENGDQLRAAQILQDRPMRGLTEIRAVGKGLEGIGIE